MSKELKHREKERNGFLGVAVAMLFTGSIVKSLHNKNTNQKANETCKKRT